MSLVDELRVLAAGATPGAIVPPSQDVRRITTAAADRLERLDALATAVDALATAVDAFLEVEANYSPDRADPTALANALKAVEELDDRG